MKEIEFSLDFRHLKIDPLGFPETLINEFELCGPKYQRVVHIFFTSRKKPEITHFNSFSVALSSMYGSLVVAVYSHVLLYVNVAHT